jgi:hypothetical protein
VQRIAQDALKKISTLILWELRNVLSVITVKNVTSIQDFAVNASEMVTLILMVNSVGQ